MRLPWRLASVMNLWRVLSGLSEHEADESNEVELCQGAGRALIIFDEPAEARGAGQRNARRPPGRAGG